MRNFKYNAKKGLIEQVPSEQEEVCVIIQVIDDGGSHQAGSNRGNGNWSDFWMF